MMLYVTITGLLCFLRIFYSLEIKKDEELRVKLDEMLDIDRYNQEALLYFTALLFGWLVIPMWLVNKVLKVINKNT